jgi:hypothetical protein
MERWRKAGPEQYSTTAAAARIPCSGPDPVAHPRLCNRGAHRRVCFGGFGDFVLVALDNHCYRRSQLILTFLACFCPRSCLSGANITD